jgi:hypothetical protein
MKFEVDNNISEVVRRMLTKMKIEGINSKNLKKKLRREPKKNTSKRPIRQKTAMYSKVPFNVKSGMRKNIGKFVIKEKKTLDVNVTVSAPAA